MFLFPTAPPPQVVHFDVKPDNLLVDGDWTTPNGPMVKVVSSGCCVYASHFSVIQSKEV